MDGDRRIVTVMISDQNRDHGKVFEITEMPAMQTEEWALRAFLALAKSGVDIPEDVSNAGIEGIARLGFKMLASMSFADAKILMDEMFKCIRIRPDRSHPDVIRDLINRGSPGDDIQEVSTRLRLRSEVFTLHTGFSLAGIASKST